MAPAVASSNRSNERDGAPTRCSGPTCKKQTEFQFRHGRVVQELPSSERRQALGGVDLEHNGSIDDHVEPLTRDRPALVEDICPELAFDVMSACAELEFERRQSAVDPRQSAISSSPI